MESDKKKKKKSKRKGSHQEETAATPERAPSQQSPSTAAPAPGSSSKKKAKKRIKVTVRVVDVLSADSVEQVAATTLTVPPVLVSFPHGRPRQADTLAFQCHATDSKGGQRRRRLRLSAETEHVAYTAEQPAVTRKATAKYMVGVYRKDSQEVVLYPVEAIVAMGQRVHVRNAAGEILRDAKEEEDESEAEEGEGDGEDGEKKASLTYAERRKSLVDTFGTKKKRRVMQSQEENRISASGVVGLNALGGFLADSLKEVQKEAAEAKQALTPAEASRATLLPPYNAQARSVEKVYVARKMLGGPEVWESVAQEVEELLRKAAGATMEEAPHAVRDTVLAKFDHWPQWVRQLVMAAPLPSANDAPSFASGADPRREHLGRLLLLRHLFELYRLPPVVRGGASSLSASLGLDNLNETVALVFLEQFFQLEGSGDERNVRHTRTKVLTDKLLLHVLVLCLVVGGFRVSATKIAQDLRMSPSECATLFRETGATTKKVFGGASVQEEDEDSGGKKKRKGTEEVMVELSLPLKFPEVKRVIRAKK